MVTVWISSATRDLMRIQKNKFYWISNRSGVAELIQTVTANITVRVTTPDNKKSRLFQTKLQAICRARLPFRYSSTNVSGYGLGWKPRPYSSTQKLMNLILYHFHTSQNIWMLQKSTPGIIWCSAMSNILYLDKLWCCYIERFWIFQVSTWHDNVCVILHSANVIQNSGNWTNTS